MNEPAFAIPNSGPDAPIDLFIEVATLAGKLGEAINAALDLRTDLLAGTPVTDEREYLLAENFQDISDTANHLAQHLREKRVGIHVQDDEVDLDVSRQSEAEADPASHPSPESHPSHLCLAHLEYLRTETTVVPGLDDPPRAHFRCKICGQHLSRHCLPDAAEILANPS